MAAGTIYCVELSVVISNESTMRKLLRALGQLDELVDDCPFLNLEEPVADIREAIGELTYEPAR